MKHLFVLENQNKESSILKHFEIVLIIKLIVNKISKLLKQLDLLNDEINRLENFRGTLFLHKDLFTLELSFKLFCTK